MLLQRRTKELQLQKARLVFDDPSSSKQTPLTIKEPISTNMQVHAENAYYEINTSVGSFNKGKQLFSPFCVYEKENAYHEINTLVGSPNKEKQLFPPFCGFEKGSTSNTCKEQ